ncbi:MAG: GntR family transcriptional regulator [Solobacterium sp.]|nr:GntR family transcriptional regulator [Solobacterium sp.]
MHIILNHTSMVPVYEQLMGYIKSAIIRGEMRPGEGLPSVRTLAAELKISALTVKKAYDRLEEEGFIVTVHGKGSFVAETDTGLAAEARRHEAENRLSQAIDTVLAAGLTKEEILTLVEILLED